MLGILGNTGKVSTLEKIKNGLLIRDEITKALQVRTISCCCAC